VVKTAISNERENVKPIPVTTLGATVMTTNLDAATNLDTAANLPLRANLPLKAKLALRPNLERESPRLVIRESLKAPNEATTTRNPIQNVKERLSNDDAEENMETIRRL
jgi:hypothetical protein